MGIYLSNLKFKNWGASTLCGKGVGKGSLYRMNDKANEEISDWLTLNG